MMREQTAVKAIIVKDGKFLLLKQHVEGKDFFTLPGGRVSNDDYESELTREVEEETGLDINIHRYVGDWHFTRESDGAKTICKTFLCEIDEGELNSEGSEDYEDIMEFIWVSKDEFLDGDYSNNESLNALVAGIDL
jgi:8-oxo-dGTP diphosphatase